MKILIVNCPRTKAPMFTLRDEICFQDVKYVPFPMRLAMTAALVREAGHEVKVIDANALRLTWEELEPMLSACDAVITQSAAGVLDHDMKLAPMVKRVCGNGTRFVMIETVISPIFPERVMADYPQADVLIRGQLERVIPELLKNWAHPEKTAGLVVRDSSGKVHVTPESNPLSVEELNQLPFMAYDLFPMEKYSISYLDAPMHERVIPGIRMRTTRDCPFKCPFCIIGSTKARGYDAKLRALEGKRAADEIEHVVRTYGIKGIFFWDETFTYNRERCITFLNELISRNLDLTWRCLTRVDCLDDEIITLMARAGCKMIEFGIESGDPAGRKSHHKGFSNEKAIEIVRKVREAGILVNCDMIVGMPWDSEESVKLTEKLALDMRADGLHLTIAFPYPGTKLYEIAEQEKLLEVDDIYKNMIEERVRVRLKPTLKTRTMSTDEVLAAWKRTRTAINKTYLRRNVLMRPWAFWPVIRHAESPAHILRMIPKGLRLLTGKLNQY